MDLKLVLFFSSMWTLARSSCKTEEAIQGTKTCGSSFKSQLAQGSFNSSNPEDLHRACCSMDQLERCLHKASAEAGCKEEVSVLVQTLTQTAKDLLGDVYNTHCKFDCNGATRTISASWITCILPNRLFPVLASRRSARDILITLDSATRESG
ncbi:hypothetical protein MTO96_024897 [Rhipicephalus appendiculatus]